MHQTMERMALCVLWKIAVQQHFTTIARMSKHVSTRRLKLVRTTECKSGATRHMVKNGKYFNALENIEAMDINVAKRNHKLVAKQQGDITVKTVYGDDTTTRTIQNVLLVNDLKCNLLSIHSLTSKGYIVKFDGDHAYASINGKTVFVAHLKGRLWEVNFHVKRNEFAGIMDETESALTKQNLWHFRLAHELK